MRRIVLLILLCTLSLSAQAQERPSKTRFLKWAYQDVIGMVQDGARPKTVGYVLGAAAILAPLSHWDEQINPIVQRHDRGQLHTFLTVANEVGNWKLIFPAAGAFAASLATHNSRLQNAAFTSLQSMFFAAKITEALKHMVGRSRPAVQEGAYEFDPFSSNNSFPSGHTTSAFALVTPWVLYYPHPITYGLFVLSTGTAVARLSMNGHWATDVIAGAAIGFTTAYYLTKRHGGLAGNVLVVPTAAPGRLGLTVQATF